MKSIRSASSGVQDALSLPALKRDGTTEFHISVGKLDGAKMTALRLLYKR